MQLECLPKEYSDSETSEKYEQKNLYMPGGGTVGTLPAVPHT